MEIIFTDFKYKKPLIPLDKNKVDTIFIHHPAWLKGTPEQIHNDHLKKYNGFGYNEYITKDSKVYIGRGDHIGAQAENYNSRSYGICLQGNYNIEPSPPDYLYEIVAERTVEAQRRFPNAKTVLPHSARFNTDCPGKNFSMGKLYDFINEVYKGQTPKPHWGEKTYNDLITEFGIKFHEKRFDDPVTRAECMTMVLQGLRSLKIYVDEGR